MHGDPHILSLTLTWFIRPGHESAAMSALVALAAEVLESEPDTLAYLVHAPFHGDDRLQALPPGAPNRVVFFEIYRSADAFLRHVGGPAFTRFVVDSVNSGSKLVYGRVVTDPNCGYRGVIPDSIPRN